MVGKRGSLAKKRNRWTIGEEKNAYECVAKPCKTIDDKSAEYTDYTWEEVHNIGHLEVEV